MLKIGDFSRLTNIPVKTIRYYDEIGLLKPTYVNSESNYRYYGSEQLILLNRILALKDVGLTLDEIKQFNKEQFARKDLLNLLNSKLTIAEHELILLNMRVLNLRARIKNIISEDNYKMIDITVKKSNLFLSLLFASRV